MNRRDFEAHEGCAEVLRAARQRTRCQGIAAEAEALGKVESAAYARAMADHWQRVIDRLIERGANIHVARALRAEGGAL